MADSKEKLFSDFAPTTTEQWMDKVTADLKGADFEKKLVWKTNEGFKVKPFYRMEDLEGLKTTDALPGEFPYLRGTKKDNNEWLVRQEIKVECPKEANTKALDILNKGVDSLAFRVKAKELNAEYIETLLEGICAECVELNFYTCQGHVVELAEILVAYFQKKGYDLTKLQGSIGYDFFDKMLANKEVKALITAMGAGIGEEDTDLDKLRYHKIIIMTDADVDGAHIRTLLLTFFFRQYQEMVEKGYVYIAQPPLYRVHNARMEKFIKDDAELNEFLLNRVSEDVTVVAANGREYTGSDLIRLMETIEKIELRVADAESTGMPRPLFLALATYPRAVDRELLEARDADFLAWLEKHEYALSLEREHSEDEDEGRVFAVFENTGSHHTRRGMEFFASRLYRQTWQLFNDLREQCGELSFSLRRKDSSSQAGDVFDLMQMTLDEARKGINIQRYKGLGEMNPEQLWVTTMNPENRVLLQVSVEDANEASDAFEELMGDRVEPRREFIERNALSVQDLDI